MIVTISNQYGSGALAVGRRVAERLDYAFVDRELPVVVAKRLNIAADDVDNAEDREPSLAERVLSVLETATPEAGGLPGERFGETTLREVQAAIREFAERGNVVLLGRGAGSILGRRPDVLRVFMHAPRAFRIERIVREGRVSAEVAAAEIDRVDRARRAYMREWYDADFGSPALYDLSLDTAHFGEDGAVDVIVAAVAAR